MTTIKSLAIVGAGGNVGKQVLPILLTGPFNITVISRDDSQGEFPEGVKVVRINYTLEHMTNALCGQDAVLCLVPIKSLEAEPLVVDAAAAAGVKWFVPSEFGHNTTDERIVSLVPPFKGKTTIIDKLRVLEKEGMNWTAIINGLFFDFGLANPMIFGIDIKGHTAKIWDEGATPFNTTNIPTVGQALLTLLSNPSAREAAKNKHVFISSFTTTQNEILSEVEKAMGKKFSVIKVSSEKMKEEYTVKLAAGDFYAAGVLLQYIAWGPEHLSEWAAKAEQGNKLLLSHHKDNLRETVERIVAQVG